MSRGKSAATLFALCAPYLCASNALSQTSENVQAALSRMSNVQLRAVSEKLQIQQNAFSEAARQQQEDLDLTRNNNANDSLAKAFVVRAREENVRETRRKLAVMETAKLVVNGAEVSEPLAELMPDVLESITVLSNPMLPLCGTSLSYRGDAASISWQHTLDKFLASYEQLLRGVGQIEVEVQRYRQGGSQPEKYTSREPVGTAFAVSDKRVVTAGHVASIFWDAESRSFKAGVLGVYFNTGGEYKYNCPTANQQAVNVKLGQVVLAKYAAGVPIKDAPLDFAVLDLAPEEPSLPMTLPLASGNASPSTFILVVSYPDADPRVDMQIWASTMSVPVSGGAIFPVTNIKRIAPGMVLPPCINGSEMHMPHDATTLNRSSGAPIFDADSGRVVAIQVSGYRDRGGGEVLCNLGLRSNAPEVTLLPQH